MRWRLDPSETPAHKLTDTVAQIVALLIPFPLPIFDHFQYASTAGKAWEIWSRAVPSGRQMIDTQRVVPNEEFRCLFCLKAGCQSVHKEDDQYHALFTTLGLN